MKFYLLLLPLFYGLSVHAQVKDCNKTRQVEQLQQLKQTISQRIDTLQVQLPELAASIVTTSKKIDQLKKEANNQGKPDAESKKEQLSKLSIELTTTTNLAESLRKKFDTRLAALDKALNLQKDLEDKITALVKEDNR